MKRLRRISGRTQTQLGYVRIGEFYKSWTTFLEQGSALPTFSKTGYNVLACHLFQLDPQNCGVERYRLTYSHSRRRSNLSGDNFFIAQIVLYSIKHIYLTIKLVQWLQKKRLVSLEMLGIDHLTLIVSILKNLC